LIFTSDLDFAKFIHVRRLMSLLVLIALTLSPSPSKAASIAGTKCTKAGITKTIGLKKFTCIKSGSKLLWSNGITTKKSAPQQPTPVAPLPSASPTASPLPSRDPLATINTPAEGVLCPTSGQLFTISGRDLICSADIGGNLTWRWRTAQAQPSPTSQPLPQQPTPNQPQPQPLPTSNQGQSTGHTIQASSPVSEVTSTYAALTSSTGTSITSSAKPASYLSALGLASTTGTNVFDHPSGLATNGTNLILMDRVNNRILVWNSAPTTSSATPDFVLCQPNTTSTSAGSALNQCNWPSDAVITPNNQLVVADTDNNRLLVWNSMPTSMGSSASFAIDLGTDAWPWGVWSDGKKLVASLTGKGQLKFWNSFPTSSSDAASFTISGSASSCLGTPRGITSDGTRLLVGEHNSKCDDVKSPNGNVVEAVTHVFLTWPTNSAATPNYHLKEWGVGTFDASSNKSYLVFMRDLHEFPADLTKNTDGTPIATGTPFDGGDGGDVAIANGHLYVTEYNGNRVSVFKGIPSARAKADFFLGSTGYFGPEVAGNGTYFGQKVENSLLTNFMITNPQVATLNGAMAINSDFDRKIYVWKKIPATDGAKPDLVWTTQNQNDSNPLLAMDFQPDSSDTGKLEGKDIYAAAGEKTFVVWNGIPTSPSDLPILNVKDSIGNITFNGALRVAVDETYFYILDGQAKRIYVWKGLPASKSDGPDFSIYADVNRIRSDGKYLIGVSMYNAVHILVWDVSTLKQDVNPMGNVPYAMNLPADAMTAGDALFVADTSFHRVLYWSTMSAAMSGAAPTAFIGTGSDTSDKRPALSETELRWPSSVWVADGYLWVGERKFGHRVLRYNLG
jgi:hypothetical protein